MTIHNTPIRTALLSVSDKTHLVELAQALVAGGVEIIATGGTAALLSAQHIPCIDIATYTGFPEIMQGRVKTLHPKIFAGLLARGEQDAALLAAQHIKPIDLLVVNLYPFARITQSADCDLNKAIEHIDIGGPSMLRAAAKNHAHVTVLCSPSDYHVVMQELADNQGSISARTRYQLAQQVFAHTRDYDTDIFNYLSQDEHVQPGVAVLPQRLQWDYRKQHDLRYGENPHQQAAVYTNTTTASGTLLGSEQLQGKPCSFNNLVDADAALACVKALGDTPACVIVKHGNPCGVALAPNPSEAYLRAYATDPVSAFGGILAFNVALDEATALAITGQQFAEVIVAPAITVAAQHVLQTKPNLRVLCCGNWTDCVDEQIEYKTVSGGLLVQQCDTHNVAREQLHTVTQRQPTQQQAEDLLFAWRIAKYVKSNAIVYAKDLATRGIGAGQMSRVFSAHIAGLKASDAQLSLEGSVMASDAFLPFADSIEVAARHGVQAIVQPGGSVRDAEVIQAADAAGMVMVFTGIRHFKH